jgi:hypothetical protein
MNGPALAVVPSSGTRLSISVMAVVRARSSARWMLSMSPSRSSLAAVGIRGLLLSRRCNFASSVYPARNTSLTGDGG